MFHMRNNKRNLVEMHITKYSLEIHLL